MPMPLDVVVIDLMLQIPSASSRSWYEFMKPLLLDRESHEHFAMPAQYMFDGRAGAGLPERDRRVRELPSVPFEDEVWPLFLRENAKRVLRLD